MFKLRTANESDLPGINQVIEAAILGWDLPERVKRLSLPSYRYTAMDLKHLEIIIAEQDGKIVALASWEPADKNDTPSQQSTLLLHGLYVHPSLQHQGLGTQLFNAIENIAKEKSFDGLLVKAQKDANEFFKKQAMQPLIVTNPDKDYENRYWKSLHT